MKTAGPLVPQQASAFIDALPDRHRSTRTYARQYAQHVFCDARKPYAACPDAMRKLIETAIDLVAVAGGQDAQELSALLDAIANLDRVTPVTAKAVSSFDSGLNELPVGFRVPRPIDYRTAYPAHAHLDALHQLTYPDEVRHLRIAQRFTPYSVGGPDSALCDEKWSAPERSTFGGLSGRAAIDQTTCADCRARAGQLLTDVEAERPLLDAELSALNSSRSVLQSMTCARQPA